VTDEEADALDKYYTKDPPRVDPRKNGGFAAKSFRMVALDNLSEDYLLIRAITGQILEHVNMLKTMIWKRFMKKSLLLRLALFAMCYLLPSESVLAAQPEDGPQQDPQTYTNSIGMEFVRIPAGSFTRTFITKNEANEEQTRHSRVIISKPFYIGIHQVTQAQWAMVMGQNPSYFKGPTHPVDSVSWDDAQEFITRLNTREESKRCRLPTEAEWELAARCGTDTLLFFMPNPSAWERAADDLAAYAWFRNNSDDKTHPVKHKKPNSYGVYDIYGNLWEWVQDGYEELPTAPEIKDYCALAEDSLRVLRGGCWMCTPEVIQAGNRRNASADKGDNHMGFRVAFSAE